MGRYEIPNLRNACRLLTLLSETSSGLLLSELVAQLRLPHTSALRIASTLADAGFLSRREGRFILGPGLIPLGLRALQRLDLRAAARPALEQLTEQSGETAHVAIVSGGKSLLVDVVQSPAPIRVGAPAGAQAELHCSATGKVLAAHADDTQRMEWLGRGPWPARTRRTLTTHTALAREWRLIRQRGYAVDNEECFDGVRCLAAPVRDARNIVVAAIGITGATSRFTAARVPAMARLVKTAAETTAKALGAPTPIR